VILVKRCCAWRTSSRFPPANTELSITSIDLSRTERFAFHLSPRQGLSALHHIHRLVKDWALCIASLDLARTERSLLYVSSRTERTNQKSRDLWADVALVRIVCRAPSCAVVFLYIFYAYRVGVHSSAHWLLLRSLITQLTFYRAKTEQLQTAQFRWCNKFSCVRQIASIFWVFLWTIFFYFVAVKSIKKFCFFIK